MAVVEYLTLSKRFFVGRTWKQDLYPGVAIAGREGFYLIFGHVSKVLTAIAVATSSYETNPTPKDPVSQNCELIWRGSYGQLGSSVTGHPDWPRLEKLDRTWFISREVIDQVKLSIWTGVTIRVGAAQYNIPVGLFSVGRVRKELLALGWL